MAIKTLEEARDLWRRTTEHNVVRVNEIEKNMKSAMSKVAVAQKAPDGTSPTKAAQPSNAMAIYKSKLAELRLQPV